MIRAIITLKTGMVPLFSLAKKQAKELVSRRETFVGCQVLANFY